MTGKIFTTCLELRDEIAIFLEEENHEEEEKFRDHFNEIKLLDRHIR